MSIGLARHPASLLLARPWGFVAKGGEDLDTQSDSFISQESLRRVRREGSVPSEGNESSSFAELRGVKVEHTLACHFLSPGPPLSHLVESRVCLLHSSRSSDKNGGGSPGAGDALGRLQAPPQHEA